MSHLSWIFVAMRNSIRPTLYIITTFDIHDTDHNSVVSKVRPDSVLTVS